MRYYLSGGKATMIPVFKLLARRDTDYVSLNYVHAAYVPHIYTYTIGAWNYPIVGKFFIFPSFEQARSSLDTYGADAELWKGLTTEIFTRELVLDPFTMSIQEVIDFWNNKRVYLPTMPVFTHVCSNLYLEERIA
jgi:hypothetical protein